MKTLVNGIEVKTVADLEKAMQWENQKGEYAEVVYVAENKEDWKNLKGFKHPYYKNGTCVGYEYTFRNWYNDREECTVPVNNANYPEGTCRAYNKELSIKYNVKDLFDLLKQDNIEIA